MRCVRVLLAALAVGPLAVALCGCSAAVTNSAIVTPSSPATAAMSPRPSASPSSSGVPADAIDVTGYTAADFASADGSIRCSLTGHDATCNFPEAMKRTGVPSPAKICPGAPLKVTGVTVSGLAEFFCSNGNDAHPEKKSSSAVWARAAGVPTVKVGADELVTLPEGRSLAHGKLYCSSAAAAVTCGTAQTGAAFTVAATGVKLTSAR